MRKILFGLIFLISLFFNVNTVNAQEVKVDHVASGLEKISEKVTMFFKFNPEEKAKYSLYLTEKRFGELKYILESNQDNLIEPTSSRFSTYLNLLTERLVKDKISSQKDSTISMSKRQYEELTKLQSEYTYDSGWWLSLQWSIDNLKGVPDKLSSLN